MERKKPQDKIRGGMTIADHVYNEKAGAYKVLGPIFGAASPKGAINSAVHIGRGGLVAIFNNSAVVEFAITGNLAVAAPSDPTDGIPVKPYDYLILAMGEDDYVIGSSADLFAYAIQDDTVLR